MSGKSAQVFGVALVKRMRDFEPVVASDGNENLLGLVPDAFDDYDDQRSDSSDHEEIHMDNVILGLDVCYISIRKDRKRSRIGDHYCFPAPPPMSEMVEAASGESISASSSAVTSALPPLGSSSKWRIAPQLAEKERALFQCRSCHKSFSHKPSLFWHRRRDHIIACVGK